MVGTGQHREYHARQRLGRVLQDAAQHDRIHHDMEAQDARRTQPSTSFAAPPPFPSRDTLGQGVHTRFER